jgi:clan AA aspartic protease (TIGR02281 family)
MRLRSTGWIAVALAVLLAGPAWATIYRWTDAQGRLHFAQNLSEVPPEHRAQASASAEAPPASPSRFQTYASPPEPAAGASASGRVFHIPFERQGNTMLVQVRVNDRVTAPFIVDTGASDVILPAAVAAASGIEVGPGTPRRTYHTANGVVSQPVVTIDAIQAGDVRVEDLQGSVSEAMHVGLLGGTFFNHFTFQVDPAASVISLVQNPGMRGGMSEKEWRSRFRTLHQRLAKIDAYMAQNDSARQDRIGDLEHHRAAVVQELSQLEHAADLAEVPQSWRD